MPITHPRIQTRRISFEEEKKTVKDVGINKWKTKLFQVPL
jgi:hypothetical protein